jgi:deoxyhypusine synthase
MSGASTNEAKSWGKLKDDSDSVTVVGDATINFPLAAFSTLSRLEKEDFFK